MSRLAHNFLTGMSSQLRQTVNQLKDPKMLLLLAMAAASDGGDGACGGPDEDMELPSAELRRYTTQEAAVCIARDEEISPGVGEKIWVTREEYSTGAEARAGLKLDKTPDGYFKFPSSRVIDPSAPRTVPGGSGTEITTEHPIDVHDIPFIRF